MIYNNAVILFRRNAEKELRSGKEAHAGLLWTAHWKGIKYDSKRGNSRSNEMTSPGYVPYDKHTFYKKMNYVQLKNITLGYNIPQTALSKIGIAALNINASINNVCTFSNVKNALNYDGTDTNANIIYTYPTARSYMLGLNLTF